MTQAERDHIRQEYGEMSETELVKVARAYDGLQEEAKTLLRDEFSRRSLEPPLIEEEASELIHQALVTVARYRDLSEAIVARSVLESAGLFCFLQDENTIRMEWGWSNALGGLRLQVAAQDADRAHELLSQPRPETIEFAEGPPFEQPRCPQCESPKIQLHGGPTKAATVSLLVFGLPLPNRSKHRNEEVWHCLNCGCTWMDDEEPPSASLR
ncbi:MAG TPA: DUF2007 domain-containing protein [Acidobacteriaceae bacterium]|nr:DUF2007 domain-containing protein [Acidobacteriaceae bacterium]